LTILQSKTIGPQQKKVGVLVAADAEQRISYNSTAQDTSTTQAIQGVAASHPIECLYLSHALAS
jgi:hypothetical protein